MDGATRFVISVVLFHLQESYLVRRDAIREKGELIEMTKRERDAFLRNRHPTKQTTISAPKREMPEKGIQVRILYNADDVELARRAKATLERWGYLCELVPDE